MVEFVTIQKEESDLTFLHIIKREHKTHRYFHCCLLVSISHRQ